MMMALGLFVFDLRSLPYQQFQHQMAWRHPSTSRVGQRPAHQFAGQDEETIKLSGEIYPELHTKGRVSLELVRAMGDQGVAWPLIEGTGMVYGFFSITDLHETKTVFFRDGAARKIEFSMSLVRVGEDNLHRLGAITSSLKSLL
jgi:hypothetical protein